MNKKLLIPGAVALVTGFLTFTAFGGKTLEQQKAEIAQMVTMKLDEIRAAKEQECTDKINEEAQRRFDEIVAQRAAEETAKPGKKPVKKGGSKGPKVDPLPQPAKPESSRDRGDAVGPANNRERGDAVPPKSNRERGDVIKKPGGGN